MYSFIKNKNSEPVIVAVIDGGVDTGHEDLREVLWVNKGEIPGNGIDDDHNGYVDDVNGWNFLGSSKGNALGMQAEITRIVKKGARFEGFDLPWQQPKEDDAQRIFTVRRCNHKLRYVEYRIFTKRHHRCSKDS